MESITTPPAHTPGPWNTHDYGDDKYPWIIIEADLGHHVAAVERYLGKDDRSAADARLIAAAPALLNLARKLVIVCHDRLADLKEEAERLSDFFSEEAEDDILARIDHYTSLKSEAENAIALIEG